MGVPSIEDRTTTCCLSPKIYQPAENMEGLEVPKKKKMFSSSSFYEEPRAIYPTVEEQVKLCRKIAESLSDDCNLKSKGANMFFRRVKKAEKWIVAESTVLEEDKFTESKDPTQIPYVRPRKDGLSRLKLILDPRQIVDMDVLLKQGVDIVQHNAISPEICHGLVKDLTSTNGRGGQLFAKRKKKSEEWIVDAEKVKHLLQTRYQENSPLRDLDSQIVAETVIRAAEAKIMTYPNAVPQVPIIESLDRGHSVNPSEAYKVRAPKGWAASTAASDLQEAESGTNSVPSSETLYSAMPRTVSFNNFNTAPRAWSAERYSQFRPMAIRSVKPPSLLLVQ